MVEMGVEPSSPDTKAHNRLSLRIVINLDNYLPPEAYAKTSLPTFQDNVIRESTVKLLLKEPFPVRFPKLVLEVLEGEFGNWFTFNR